MSDRGIRAGRLLGIEIRLDPSWFVILILIGWTFTAGLFPTLFPDLSQAEGIMLGIVATLLFFASIVIHELSHSLYARSQGMRIRRITLFIFGGAAEIMDEAKTPRQEFIMAAVGPLTSIVLSVFFAALWIAGELYQIVPLVAIGSTLAVINFVLAVFNLLPGFPLDGGRMFRAAVWKVTGNAEKATNFAATGGQVLSFVLIFYGALQFFNLNFFGGIWLVLIGVFLNYAAMANRVHTIARLKLRDKTVADFMESDYDEELAEEFVKVSSGTLHQDDPAIKALGTMSRLGRKEMPVVEGDELIGVLRLKTIHKHLRRKSRRRKTKD